MKAVLFDFGGTIDTDGIHWSEKFWELYEQFGVEVTKPAFEQAFVQSEAMLAGSDDVSRATMYRTLHKQLTLQFAILRLDGESAIVKQMVEAVYRDVVAVVARAAKLLGALQPHYTLGVVSNFYGNLQVVCREFDIERFFSTMIDSAVVGVRKPDPAIFRLALERLAVRPDDCTMVGDSYERDIVPAKEAGLSTVWLKGRSWITHPSVGAADYTITSLEGIRNILLRPEDADQTAS